MNTINKNNKRNEKSNQSQKTRQEQGNKKPGSVSTPLHEHESPEMRMTR